LVGTEVDCVYFSVWKMCCLWKFLFRWCFEKHICSSN
jgi:hypothetical protein